MNYVELRAGVEPAIYSLQVNCLTIRLSKHKVELFRTSTNPIFYKWGYDLIYYCNYILAGHRGLEPRTHDLTDRRYCQLSYGATTDFYNLKNDKAYQIFYTILLQH